MMKFILLNVLALLAQPVVEQAWRNCFYWIRHKYKHGKR